MIVSEFSKSIIALACWRAAQHELHQTMQAVCMVFKNRADAGWYDGDLYLNASVWLLENPGDFPDTRDPEFQKFLNNFDAVTSGFITDKTNGAYYFVHKRNLPEKIEGQIVANVGNLVFVR